MDIKIKFDMLSYPLKIAIVAIWVIGTIWIVAVLMGMFMAIAGI
jgi:hypothetical protein